MALDAGRLDKRPGAVALRLRWYGPGDPDTVSVGAASWHGWAGSRLVRLCVWASYLCQHSCAPVLLTLPQANDLRLHEPDPSSTPPARCFLPSKQVHVERRTHKESWKGEESVKERFTLPANSVLAFLEGELPPGLGLAELQAKVGGSSGSGLC